MHGKGKWWEQHWGSREWDTSHSLGKAERIRRIECRKGRRQDLMELFWHNIQWVTMNIKLSRDLQIGP